MLELQQTTVRNRLLKAMSADDFALLRPHLQPMATALRQQLIAPNMPIRQLYFPESGLGSVVSEGGGSMAEVGIIGREGLGGASPVLLGVDRTPYEHFVQNPGEMLCIDTEALREAIGRSVSLHRLLLRSIHVQMIQTAQTAFVNATYTIEVRLARWLLMCHDRLDGDELHLTHEFLAVMLGVRRSGTTLAVQALEGYRLIKARRARITILDRKALERIADDAYGLPEAEFARLIEGA